MPAGNAIFGSGLQSVTFCRPHMREIGVRVIVGRVLAKWYNAYYDTAYNDTQMDLAKRANVNVRVECAALGYDSGALGVDGALPAAYHDVADIDNDPVVYDDMVDLSTMRGDAVRYFVLRNAEPDTEYDVTVSTDCVADNTNGKLQSHTFTFRTLPRDDLKLGGIGCVKNSYFNRVDGINLFLPGHAYHGWTQGEFGSLHTYGTPVQWAITGIVASVVTFTGTGLSEGDILCLRAGSAVLDFIYVSGLSGNTFTAQYPDGTNYDFVAELATGADTLSTCHDEPLLGMWGLHVQRMKEKGMNCFIGLEDNIYCGQKELSRSTPVIRSSHTRQSGVQKSRTFDAMFNAIWDRSGSREQVAMLHQARNYFCLPQVLEALQSCAGAFNRGDHDFTPKNGFEHSAIEQADFGGTLYASYVPVTDSVNPLADANYPTRMTERVRQWKNCTDVWRVYFEAGNPVTFSRTPLEDGVPPALTVDAAGAHTVDPVATYGADKAHYLTKPYVIETELHCVLVPDMYNRRGGSFPSYYNGHEYVSQYSTPFHANHIYGGEQIYGGFQKEEIKHKCNSVAPRKSVVVANKGLILGAPYNFDAPKFSAIAENDEMVAFYTGLQDDTLVMCGDRHDSDRTVV